MMISMEVELTSHYQNNHFQLEPLEQQQQQRAERGTRQKRKRKLIIDEQKNISGDEMKANMADYRLDLNVPKV